MLLTNFLLQLFEKGKVTVAGQVKPFSVQDLSEAEKVLEVWHQKDALEMPLQAPAFASEAAIWAANFLYRTIQLVMLRDLGEEAVDQHLGDFPYPFTAANIYSVDLCFRYLPDVFNLAKGLSPEDVLVKRLKKAAAIWPLSSIGIPQEETIPLATILQNKSLTYAYRDRIIAAKDLKRAQDEAIRPLVAEALGNYTATFWPEFDPIHNNV